MIQVVAFDPAYWAARYPEFATVPLLSVEACFTEAGLYCDNSGAGVVTDQTVGGQLYVFLHMLTAHIVALNFGVGGQAASPLVGRISNASEGSVSVAASFEAPGTAAWYVQTKYGAAYWAATAQYRSMRYVPPPPRCGPYQGSPPLYGFAPGW
jgi:hypothetical protein